MILYTIIEQYILINILYILPLTIDLLYVFEYCCSFRMLRTLAETCSSTFVIQFLL